MTTRMLYPVEVQPRYLGLKVSPRGGWKSGTGQGEEWHTFLAAFDDSNREAMVHDLSQEFRFTFDYPLVAQDPPRSFSRKSR